MQQGTVVSNAADRRSFLKGAGFTGLGLAGAALIGSKFVNEQKVEAATYSDADIPQLRVEP